MDKQNQNKTPSRSLKPGDWYWMDKAVIRSYTPRVGPMGIVVYNFLASFADGNQQCFPSQKYIAKSLGCSRSTVNKAIKKLEKCALIRKEKRGRHYCTYSLLEVRCRAKETQMSHGGNSDVAQSHSNDKKRTIINNDIDKAQKAGAKIKAPKTFEPKTREEMLALDLARALNDYEGLALYISFARKYPESFLRQILGEVKEIPENRIKKSRAALYNHMVRKNFE